MKQRKKVKYVQKQPPDKSNQKIEQKSIEQAAISRNQEDRPNRQYKNQKVESHNLQNQTYFASESRVQNQEKSKKEGLNKKYQSKTRYIAKQEMQANQSKNTSETFTKSNIRNNNSRKYQEVPQFNQRESSHHEHHCIICSEEIRRKDWIWTCSCCCISMHLKCIKQWIQNINQQLDKKATVIFNWKCPQCNYEYNQPIPKYYCYCGKHLNPEYDRDLQPHSCGEICNKKRGSNCNHPCEGICHSGKCKPCDYQGTVVKCQCGKSERKVKCSEQRLAFQCGKKCQKILNCHNHKCQRNCHTGDCIPCKKKHMVSCYCGKSDDIIDCALPSYSCEEICRKTLDCGYHNCEQKCHLGACNKCNKIPEIQKTCPCGKYQIQMLTGDPDYRKSCADEIPECGMPCGKKLGCGHICPRSCHEGLCSPCKVNVEQTCICGLQTRKIQCRLRYKQNFKCESVCKKKRSCGQHICNQVCCKFRNSPIIQNHPCQLSCNKKLNCEKHQCGQACHLGLCKKCPVIYSQPQPCPCGKSFLKPPIICGTLTPQCNNICEKQLPCKHKCKNSCHYGICKCYEDIVIPCRCKKEQISTTCGREALCLNKCQLLLQCGHKCDLQCHKDTCLIAHKANPCRKICNKERKDCHHFCPQLCHPGQQCESFSCEAEILVKCDCGHRQTMSLCGAHDHHKTKKAIVCNKKCENLKRFDILYKDKEAYYPGNMVQFAFKNFVYLQNLESKLERFILHSQDSFIEIQYKFSDNNSKILLTNLFENHYHLNTHFYRHKKYTAFTLMQSQYTMIPKPVLTEYAKMISKGIIKQSNLPFQFTISFECDQKQKTDLIIKNLKQFIHKYYTQRNSRMISLHFWSRYDGEQALKFLEYQYQLMQFRCSYNINKNEQEIGENEIIQSQITEQQQKQIKQKQQIQLKQKRQQSIKQVKQILLQQKIKQKQKQDSKQKQKQKQKQKSQPFKRIASIKDNSSNLIIRKGLIPNFKKNDYPQSKQNIQDIYLLDEDELYNENTNWQQLIKTLCNKKMSPQAIQWRIRSLIIINSFYNINQNIFNNQFNNIIKLYNKDKQSAIRILDIQRIDNKSVKKQMQSNSIYLSDHQPEIISYLIIYNYLASQKIQLELPNIIQNTPQIIKVQQIIQSIQEKNIEQFYHHFISADYVLACQIIPLVHQLREIILQEIIKGARISTNNLFKYLLFNSEQQFIDYAHQNGIVIYSRTSKTTKENLYYLKQGKIPQIFIKNNEFLSLVYAKRDKKFFLSEPQELVNDQYMTRSFFAFGDFKQSISPKYMTALVKLLKQKQ